MLLVPSYGQTFERSGQTIRYAPSSANKEVHACTKEFAECGGSSCGCYRLRWPWVRVSFRNLVVRKTVRQMAKAARVKGESAVRYVSIGCGTLMTDFEILCGLQMKGLTIEAISVVDLEYRTLEPGNDSKGHIRRALQALYDFFPSARVSAFGEMSALRQAARDFPSAYGGVTTVVRCDAMGVPQDEAKALAARLLVPGGHYFVQSNSISTRKLKDGTLDTKGGGLLNDSNDDKFNGARDCFVRDPIRHAAGDDEADGGVDAEVGVAGLDAVHRVGWPADPFFVSHMRRVPLRGIEGDGPLVTAAELAKSVPDAKLYRIDTTEPAPIYEGDATQPNKSAANRVLGTRKPGTYLLGQPPLREDADGVWVRVHRHDPHRFCDGWFGAASAQPTEQWVRLAGSGESDVVTEINTRAGDGVAPGGRHSPEAGRDDAMLALPCEPDGEEEIQAAKAEVDALVNLPTGGAPILEDQGRPPPPSSSKYGNMMLGATYNAFGAGIH